MGANLFVATFTQMDKLRTKIAQQGDLSTDRSSVRPRTPKGAVTPKSLFRDDRDEELGQTITTA